MLALTLALFCSMSWGTSDFLGGLLGRRIPLLTVLAISQLTALAAGLAFAAGLGGAPSTDAAMLVALAAGAVSVAGIGALYRGLSVGTMGVVAPIAGTSALLPIAVGVAGGDRPGTVQAIGMAVALTGVLITSREASGPTAPEIVSQRKAIAFGIAAAAAFGAGQVMLDVGAAVDVYWTIGFMRIGGIATLAVVMATLWGRAPLLPAEGDRLPLRLIMATGLLDVAAATFYAAATTHGLLSVVAVLGSLYPVVTVLLARAVLAERLERHQAAGATITLAGILAVGSGL